MSYIKRNLEDGFGYPWDMPIISKIRQIGRDKYFSNPPEEYEKKPKKEKENINKQRLF